MIDKTPISVLRNFGKGGLENFSTVPFHQRRVHGESCGVNVSQLGGRWGRGKGSEIEKDELGLLWPAMFLYVATTLVTRN